MAIKTSYNKAVEQVKLDFPCILIFEDRGLIVLATKSGTGTVLDIGDETRRKVGEFTTTFGFREYESYGWKLLNVDLVLSNKS